VPRAETRRSSTRSTRAAKQPDKVMQYVLSSPWAISEAGLHRVMAIASRMTFSPEALESRQGKPLGNARCTTVRDGVATIDVRGPLVKRAAWFNAISGACDYEAIGRDLRAALDDREVEHIVLSIDSPGGEVSGCSELAQHILAARNEKPVYAYVSGECCSAAYWLASACEAIYVADTALVGNLGVLMTMVDDTRRMKAEGLERITIVSSQTPAKPHDVRTEPGRERVQALVDSLAEVFLGAVANGRGIERDEVLQNYGAGGVFVGAESVTQGLADDVTTYEALMASLAGAEHSATPTRETDMPALKKGRALAGRAQAGRTSATPKAKAGVVAKPKAKKPTAEDLEREEEMDDDETPVAEDPNDEEIEASDDTMEEDDEIEASADEEDDEPVAPKSKKAAATAALSAATAERTRIISILGYADRFGMKALMPFIEDPSCTKAKAAEQLLEQPAAAGNRLRALKGDEEQLQNAPKRVAANTALGKTGARLLSALGRVNPAALPDSAKAGLLS
jgi:ClpP class serine protease